MKMTMREKKNKKGKVRKNNVVRSTLIMSGKRLDVCKK